MRRVGRRVFMTLLLAFPIAGATRAQDRVSGVTGGWSWNAAAAGANFGPPPEQVTRDGRPAPELALDFHVAEGAAGLITNHHLKFAPGTEGPLTVTLSFDAKPGATYDAPQPMGDNGLFVPETLSSVADLTASTVRTTQYDLEYADGSRRTYRLDNRGFARAAQAAVQAWNDLDLEEGAGCFMTTAACGLLGLPDDVFELTWARRLRDEYLANRPEGRALTARYYLAAPRVLAAMGDGVEGRRSLLWAYWTGILPAAVLARLGLQARAAALYARMFKRLARRWAPEAV